MKVLVTGSAGHLGEALMRVLEERGMDAVGIDKKDSPYTTKVGTISCRDFVAQSMKGIDAVIHCATLQKPHVVTHSHQDFIDTNLTGTLNLLEEAKLNGVKSFIYTSTTSTFGDMLRPPPGEPAIWVTEDVVPVPKNIYGVTKAAAEDLCQLFYRNHNLPCLILKTSRFFPEDDDKKSVRDSWDGENSKANEFLYRRADIEDIVSAHLLAIEKAPEIGFAKYIISATTPFTKDDLKELRGNAQAVVKRIFPEYEELYKEINWKMLSDFDRVYVNEKARKELGWKPRYDFAHILQCLREGKDFFSQLTRLVGIKGYHDEEFVGEPFPVVHDN